MAERAKVEGQSEGFGVLMTVCAKVHEPCIPFGSTTHGIKLSRI